MTIIKITDMRNQGIEFGSVHCPFCDEEIEEFIGIHKVAPMCVNCAQNVMRTMFENLIEYHNGKAVSLIDIMQHGDPDYIKNKESTWIFWMEEKHFKPSSGMDVFYLIASILASKHNELSKNSEGSSKPVNDGNECVHCEICETQINKWVKVFPSYVNLKVTLCIDCAQYVVRTLLEDIIECRNGVRVNLADIMFYGNPEIDEMSAEAKRQFIERRKLSEKSSEIINSDNEINN
jgi:hypothetical protein